MPRIGGPPRGEGVQAVGMALQILEHLAARRGAQGVTELARHMQTTKSRMHRHLRSLIAGGYVVQPPGTGKYQIGGRLLALGRHATTLCATNGPHVDRRPAQPAEAANAARR